MSADHNHTTTSSGAGTATALLETKARARNFDVDQPRDRKGRWIETGATVSIWGGGTGTVAKNLGNGRLEVHTTGGRKIAVHRSYLTVTKTPAGSAPSTRDEDKPRPQQVAKPSADVEDHTPTGDTPTTAAALKPGQIALVRGTGDDGQQTARFGRIHQVTASPGGGVDVVFVDDNERTTIRATSDADARIVPEAQFTRLVTAEQTGDWDTADRIAAQIYATLQDEGAPAADPDVRADDAPETGTGQGIPRAGQWINTPAFNDPVRVEQVQDTLTGAEIEVTTIRGDRRTLAEADLAEWQPVDEPRNHRADGAPAAPQTRPQQDTRAAAGTGEDTAGTGEDTAGTGEDTAGTGEDTAGTGEDTADSYEARLEAASHGEAALHSTLNFQQIIMRAVIDRRIRQREMRRHTDSVAAYTEKRYAPINQALYAARGGDLPEDTPSDVRDQIADLDLLLSISPSNRDAVYHRGLREPQLLLDNPSQWNPQGGNQGIEFTGHAFTSVSADENIARRFADARDPWGRDVAAHQSDQATNPTLFRILAPAGTRSLQLTDMHVAGEVLLDRGLRYRVAADHGVTDGIHRLDLEIIPGPEPERLQGREERRKQAAALSKQAREHFDGGDHDAALTLIDQAEQQDATLRDWGKVRDVIRKARPETPDTGSPQQRDDGNTTSPDTSPQAAADIPEQTPPGDERHSRLNPAPGVFSPAETAKVEAAAREFAAQLADTEREPSHQRFSDVGLSHLDLAAAVKQAARSAPKKTAAKAEQERITRLAKELWDEWIRRDREQDEQNRPAVPPPQPPAEPAPRPDAPEGEVYADQVQPGDTVKVPVAPRGHLGAPGPHTPLRPGRSIYQVPSAYQPPTQHRSRTVVEVRPGTEAYRSDDPQPNVTLVFDDGTTRTYAGNHRLTRGRPVEVFDGGTHVGDWMLGGVIRPGERIRLTYRGSELPRGLDPDTLGIADPDRVTVEGRVARRLRGGTSTVVLDEITIRRDDGTAVDAPSQLPVTVQEHVIRLAGHPPSPTPRHVSGADLVAGDRILAPGGAEVTVESVHHDESTGITAATTRDDQDGRHRHLILPQATVPLASALPAASSATPIRVEGLAVGDWVLNNNGIPSRVVSAPVTADGHVHVQIADVQDGGVRHVEYEPGEQLLHITSASTAVRGSVELERLGLSAVPGTWIVPDGEKAPAQVTGVYLDSRPGGSEALLRVRFEDGRQATIEHDFSRPVRLQAFPGTAPDPWEPTRRARLTPPDGHEFAAIRVPGWELFPGDVVADGGTPRYVARVIRSDNAVDVQATDRDGTTISVTYGLDDQADRLVAVPAGSRLEPVTPAEVQIGDRIAVASEGEGAALAEVVEVRAGGAVVRSGGEQTYTPLRETAWRIAGARRVEPLPLDDQQPSGRVRLRTDQRNRVLDLGLDTADSPAPDLVRQAAARLRARQTLSGDQMRALAAHLRRLAADEQTPAARRRALTRTAAWVDAAHARLEGFPPPPHDPGRPTPQKTFTRNLSMGDVIAVPGPDGQAHAGTVTFVRRIKGFGLISVAVRRNDGTVDQLVLPDSTDLWLLPDLPPDKPTRPEGFTREHVTADRVNVGDTVRWDGDQIRDPVIGRIETITLRGGEYQEVRRYEATIRDGDGRSHTVTVNDRGWPSLVRYDRGAASAGQPYTGVMPPENPEPVGWRDLRVGDRATVSLVTGTVTGIHTGRDGDRATVMVLSDNGEHRAVPVADDPDQPEDHVDVSVMRLIGADGNAAGRIDETQREHARITREREFSAFLAGVETSRSRWAATDIAEALRGLPAGADRNTAFAAAAAQLDRVEAADDQAGRALAYRLGARDDTQAAAMAQAVTPAVDAVKRRATDRIRRALLDADPLPGETWPQTLGRVAASYRDHPPAPGVAPAGVSLARLRDRITTRETPSPRLQPDTQTTSGVAGRMAGYRAQLPDDLADLGRRPVTRALFDPTSLEDLEAGRVPPVRETTLWDADVADDDGPGEDAMRQLAVLRTAGRDLDARYQQHLAGRETVLRAELDAVTKARGEAWKTADDLDTAITSARVTGAPTPADGEARRAQALERWRQTAAREAELRSMLSEARRDALAATLAEVRPIGGEGVTYTDRTGRALTGRAGSNAAALRYAEQLLPSDWLAVARQVGPVEVVSGPGRHLHTRRDGTTRISLPADDNTAAPPAGTAAPVPMPTAQPGGVPKATVAAHELGHHMEAVIPGLREAGHALLWDRTSRGPVGERTRDEPLTGQDRGRAFSIYPGDLPDARTGRVNHDGSQEVFATVLESLAGNGDYLDDDLRQWGLGVMALLATDQRGPRAGAQPAERVRRDPLEGVDLPALSDEQLRGLLARIDDPAAAARLRAELDRRTNPPAEPAPTSASPRVDVEQLDDDELAQLIADGWDTYGRDPDRTALQDRLVVETEARHSRRRHRFDTLDDDTIGDLPDDELIELMIAGWEDYGQDPVRTARQDRLIAETEAREAARNQDRSGGLEDLASSDLLSMETDDLAGLFAANLGRYGIDPSVTALLDRISAELEDRDRARRAADDPYAHYNVQAMPDGELEDLKARHMPSYHSDPHSAALISRVFAELDARHRDQNPPDDRTPEEQRTDELIAQGWDPREAYAEAHGLDAVEMERQERRALIDAQRAPEDKQREDTVRRMYRQWVHEQWLAAEQATRGYLLSRLGVKAGVDPRKLWGGNPVHARAYASEELKRWWAEQPNGGRMTYAEWRAQWLGTASEARAARERRITSGNGRDLG
ncbi:ADP-ribosyltransferase exoenzyme [Sinosporangium album]|uniref:ADP-ribosyltransferase exoenzyme n=1 Tax=Sinosporangium album TaxID=504805 RepID=A0A1G8ECU0_9ACTN|nr:ADP-ribosyltransferase [Sinosporangium album]SDH67687.1 ADP-ribosyltransferase exoenzyme [Sinosporangium album]